jgi:hypothetical protein
VNPNRFEEQKESERFFPALFNCFGRASSVFERVKQEDGMNKSDEYSKKIAGLMELAERYGVKVKESSVGSIGFVGGVSRSQAKPVSNDNTPAASPKQYVN